MESVASSGSLGSQKDLPYEPGLESVAKNQPGLEVYTEPRKISYFPWRSASKDLKVDVPQSYTAYPGYPTHSTHPTQPTHERNEQRTILGLRVWVFWAMVVLLIAILAGGIGGGVGYGLSSKKATCLSPSTNGTNTANSANSPELGGAVTLQPTACTVPPSSSSSSSSSTFSTASSTVSPAPSPFCTSPGSNGSTITPLNAGGSPIKVNSNAQNFRVYCNTNWPGGTFNRNVHDIMQLWAPDLSHCLALCAEYNLGVFGSAADETDPRFCRAVSLVLDTGEYCYLKNDTGKNDTTTSGPVGYVSAMLI